MLFDFFRNLADLALFSVVIWAQWRIGSAILAASRNRLIRALVIAFAVWLAVGFALKLLDGDVSGRARNPAIIEGLRQAGFLDEDALSRLEGYWMEEIRNRPGDVVGMVRPAFTLSTG